MTTPFAKKTLALHNNYRTRHGAPPLEWSEELEKAANEHAAALLHSHGDESSLTPKQGVLWGQNLFEYEAEGCDQVTDDEAIEDAVHTWYEDSANYDPQNPSASKGGNFSQLIWSTSQRVGAGIAKKVEGNSTSIVVIAFYDPPANHQGQFEANVSVQNLASSMRSANSNSSSTQSNQKSETTITTSTSTNERRESTSVENVNQNISTNENSSSSLAHNVQIESSKNVDATTSTQNQQKIDLTIATDTGDSGSSQNLESEGQEEGSKTIITSKTTTTKTTTTGGSTTSSDGQDLVSNEMTGHQIVDTISEPGQNTNSIATKNVTTTTTCTTVKGSEEPIVETPTSTVVEPDVTSSGVKKITTTKTVTTTTVKGTTMDDSSGAHAGQGQNDPIVEMPPEIDDSTDNSTQNSTERIIKTTVQKDDQKDSTRSDNQENSNFESTTGQNVTKVTKTTTTTTVKGSSSSSGTDEGQIDLTSQITRDQDDASPSSAPPTSFDDDPKLTQTDQNSTCTTKKVTTVTTVKGSTTSGQDTDGRALMTAVRDLIPAATAAGLDVNTTSKTDVQNISEQNLTGTKKVTTVTTTIKGKGQEGQDLMNSVLQNLVPMATTGMNDSTTKITTTTKTTSSTTEGHLLDTSNDQQNLTGVDIERREGQILSTSERRDSSSKMVDQQTSTKQVRTSTNKTEIQKGSTCDLTPVVSDPGHHHHHHDQQSKTMTTTTTTTTNRQTMTTDDNNSNHGNQSVQIEPVSSSHTSTTRKVTVLDDNSEETVGSKKTADTAVTSNKSTTTTTTTRLTTETLNVAVQLHNELRRRHGAPAVTIDHELCNQAQTYAKSIVRQTTIEKSEKRIEVGQNIYRLSGSLIDPSEAMRQAVDVWYSKVTEYNWDNPLASGSGYQLFSQLVWKSVKTIGVGMETEGTKTAICVLYSPPGNIVSEERFKENVQPAQN